MVGDDAALPAIVASLPRVARGVPVFAVIEVENGPEHQQPLESPGEVQATWVHGAMAREIRRCSSKPLERCLCPTVRDMRSFTVRRRPSGSSAVICCWNAACRQSRCQLPDTGSCVVRTRSGAPKSTNGSPPPKPTSSEIPPNARISQSRRGDSNSRPLHYESPIRRPIAAPAGS